MFGSSVQIEEVYAWGNGFNRWEFEPFEGDGNGFKLGIEDNPPAGHVVQNSIAFGNFAKGFIDNGNPGALIFERNTAWNNGDSGFVMRSSESRMEGNVAAENGGEDEASLVDTVTSEGNSWDGDEAWGNASFASVDAATLMGARGEDGRVQGSEFLIPAGGEAIGATTLEEI